MEKAKHVDEVLDVKGDLGIKRQREAVRAFRGIGGKDEVNPFEHTLHTDSAIDAKFGPGDKICGS